MTSRNYIFFLSSISLFSLLAFSACKSNKDDAAKTNGKPKGLQAEGYIVQPQVFQAEITASGTLRPNEEIEILPEVSGRITAILFNEGGFVKKGQTLLQLNDADIRAQIEKLKTQKELQRKLLERQDELLGIGGISKQDYETTQSQIASINADIAFQEAQLRKTRIIAPFDGRIGIRSVSVGAIVSPASVITTLQQLNPLKMDFTIPGQYSNVITSGTMVSFTVDGQTDTLSGKITAIDPGANVNTRSIKVRAVVPNEKGRLTSGSFAHVQIPNESDKDAILIPSEAVIPTTRDKKVAVVKQGKAQLVTVELGIRTADKVQVVRGLSVGDTVITTGIMQVKPGMDVKITKLRS